MAACRTTLRLSTLFAFGAAALLSGAIAGAGENPISKYLDPSKLDEYNEDVKAGKKGTPKAGGRLRIRQPADYQDFHPILSTGQPERVVINHLSDGLVDLDVDTYEYYPEIAQWWRETDVVKKKGAEQQFGRVTAQTEDSVTFVPDAWIYTYSRYDIETVDAAGGKIVLKAALGGATINGTVTDYLPTTIKIDTATDPALAAKAITIPMAEIDTWEDSASGTAKQRPFVKPHCAFEFYIRDGVTWHDGQPFTADDVVFTIKTILNPDVDAAHVRNYYQDITQYEAFDGGKAVRMVYAKPYYTAISFLGFINGSSYLLPKHVFKPENFGGDEAGFAKAFNEHPYRRQPLGTGPFKFKEWKQGQTATVVRNENYWKNKLPQGALANWTVGQPYMDSITWYIINDKTAATQTLLKQEVDADLDVEPDTWVQESTNSAEFKAIMTRAKRLGFLYTYIGWNMQREIFKDKEVRKALAMLIPRDKISKEVLHDLALPVSGPFYLKGPGYDSEVKPVEYNPAQAKRILGRAGWLDRNGDGVLEKEINGQKVDFAFDYMIHNARDYHQKIADIIKESVEQAKIRVTITKMDWSIFADKVRDKQFDAVRFAWGTDLDPDPYQIWHSSQSVGRGDNFVSYKNDRVDQICLAIREEFDPQKRWELAREMHRIVAEDQPYCFLTGFEETYFINRKIQGVKLYASQYPTNFAEWYWAGDPPAGAK